MVVGKPVIFSALIIRFWEISVRCGLPGYLVSIA